MHSAWSVDESAPVPHADTYSVTSGCDHRCIPFLVHRESDEGGIYGEQHEYGGYPANWRHISQSMAGMFEVGPAQEGSNFLNHP